MKMREVLEDALPANCLSGGHVEGTGGENGEPAGKKKKRRTYVVRRAVKD